MSATATALLAYIAWTLLLVGMIGIYRSGLVMTTGRAANSFSPSGDDVDGFGKRVTRAHANCYENLPVAGGLMLYAIATEQTAITDPLASALIGARLAQSGVHLISTSRPAVLVRFVFFLVQIAVLVWWLISLAGLA